jgi:hypothetical protein
MRLSTGHGILEVVAEREATTAVLLDAIHGTVGFIEELLHVAAVYRVETDTNAGADCAVTAFDAERAVSAPRIFLATTTASSEVTIVPQMPTN